MEILKAENIYKSFGDNKVLKGASLTLNKGEIVSLLGVSGGGKTTLFNVLSGIHMPDSGKVWLNGEDITGKPGNVSYMLQKDLLLPYRKVIDNVSLPLVIKGVGKKEARAQAEPYFKTFGLDGTQYRYPSQLSGGMRQRAALLRTYLSSNGVALLDEPFSGLDPVNSRILQDVVMELIGQNKIVIFSSHQMSYVEEFCKDIVIINKGDVVLSGDLDNIKREFGKNQLIVSAVDKTLDDLENIINEHMSDILEITGRTKEELIIKNVADVSRKQILSKFISENIEIERFETYKPSLNDIFVSKVGDADEKEAAE